MLPRELEPEVMNDPSEARDYDAMNHAAVNRQFVADFVNEGLAGLQRVLDVGTGTARIPIELCSQLPDCSVVGNDAAASMLQIGGAHVTAAGLSGRIVLDLGDAKALRYADRSFDAVISNSLIHHLAEPQWALLEMVRVLRPRGRLFVRDLVRPATREAVEQLVESHAAHETAANQQLLRQSLLAALTLDEMRGLAREAGLPADSVQLTSDRHWTLSATT
jgi:ubiquinone/menaquinone biosynthesis C-methylase UbiE